MESAPELCIVNRGSCRCGCSEAEPGRAQWLRRAAAASSQRGTVAVMTWLKFLCAGLLAASVVDASRAGGITDCQTPYAYDTAVNVFVLEDSSDDDTDQALRDMRRRLTWL